MFFFFCPIFFHMEISNDLLKYCVDCRFFAFFVRNNPLFLDETGLYSLCRKVVDLYEQDEVKFQNKVQLDTGNKITLKDWMKKVRNPVLCKIINFNGGINIWKYKLPHGSVEFTRNSFGHVRKNQVWLEVLYHFFFFKIIMFFVASLCLHNFLLYFLCFN